MTDSAMKINFDPETLDWEKTGGMMPAIVQNAYSGKVLMFAYMTKEALKKTLDTGLATFFSRTKNRLWTKGEESGHSLNVKALTTDCDRDTILVSVDPIGPTCHNGTESCFDLQPQLPAGFLGILEQVCESRKGADPASSYTAKLYSQGVQRIGKKVGEEAVETVIAAMQDDKQEFIGEVADLLFHLSVLVRAKDASFAEVMACLEERHGGYSAYKEQHAQKKAKTC